MFKGKKRLTGALVVAAICALLIGSLVVAQTFFFQVPGGGLIFDQFNPAIRYAGRLSFQNLAGTLQVKAPLTATATLDFANATTGTCSTDLTVAVTGAADGDVVLVAPPAGAIVGGTVGSLFHAWVSSTDLVAVRHCNVSASSINPASGTYRVDVWGH